MYKRQVLIKPKNPQSQTKSGLYLPPTVQQEKIQSGYIIKVGPGFPLPSQKEEHEVWEKKEDEAVHYLPLQAHEGDLAVYQMCIRDRSTNFVSMDGNRATIQLAFNGTYAGPNGIGGITVEGNASNVEMKTDKKGNITFSMMVPVSYTHLPVFPSIWGGKRTRWRKRPAGGLPSRSYRERP